MEQVAQASDLTKREKLLEATCERVCGGIVRAVELAPAALLQLITLLSFAC